MKLLAPLIWGPERAHFQNWSFGLEIRGRSVSHPGDVFYQGEKQASLSFWRDLRPATGARLLVVGSGPSLNRIDIERLPPGTAILVNSAISLIASHGVRPLAIAVEDERFFWRHGPQVLDQADPKTPCLLSPGAMRCLFELDLRWQQGRQIVLVDDARKPYGRKRLTLEQLSQLDHIRAWNDAFLSTEPDCGVAIAGSVGFSALQFALAARPVSIGLLGIDISNANEPRFNETVENAAPSGIAVAEDRLLRHFALARIEANARGTEIVNHSPVSALSKIGYPYDGRYERS